MDTRAFFDLIWPSQGWRCIAFIDPRDTPDPATGRLPLRHRWYDDNDKAAGAVKAIDAAGATVYHGCSSFADKAAGRKQVNAAYAKAFWMDLDCGPGKPYAARSAAAKAVLDFATRLGLANPYLVGSGNGVHAYWPLGEAITSAEWVEIATMLKAAARELDLGADPTRTADSASVLRPVGSHHRKNGDREVRMALPGQVTTADAVRAALVAFLGEGAIPAPTGIAGSMASVFQGQQNTDLTGGLPEYLPRAAEPIAEKCGVVKLMRDTQGNVDQPTWYGVLGVLAFAEDGDQFAHAWSCGHPQYSKAETDKKLEQARRFAPTTCAKLGEHQGAICAACPLAGKIKSPIVLGAPEPEPITTIVPVSLAAGRVAQGKALEMPDGYALKPLEGRMAVWKILKIKDVNDAGQDITRLDYELLSRTPFYAVSRLSMDKIAHMELEALDRDGKADRFVLPGDVVGKGKDAVAGALGRQEIVGAHRNADMDGYLRGWMQALRDQADKVQAHGQFGWTEDLDAFVVGETVYTKEGAARAVVNGLARGKASALTPKGSAEEWVRIVDRAYNAAGQEGYQFMVVCGFAAPLMKLMNVDGGLTIYAHSEGSGVGKTTAQKAALSIWGNWRELMLADGKVTTNALWATIGAYNSLPVAYDELTNMANGLASDLVYSVSQGMARQRLAASGDLRTNNGNWNTLLLASGNNLLSEKLSLHRANAAAESARLFEYTLSATGHLAPNEALELFPKLLDHYGHAGGLYAQYLVDHLDSIKATLASVQAALNVEFKVHQSERFWSAMMAAALVSLTICRKLGLLRFDVAAFKLWLYQRLEENRVQSKDVASEPLEIIGRMLADLWPGILITKGEGDFRSADVAIVIEKPKGPLVGRAILPKDAPGPGKVSNTKPTLLLSVAAVKDWANKKGVSAKEMVNAGVAAGWIAKDPIRYSLGRGTVEYTAVTTYINCWKLDPEKIESNLGHNMASTRLGVVTGGSVNAVGGANRT